MADSFTRVLVVEDNPGDARLIQEMLVPRIGRRAYEMHWVTSLEEGLQHIRQSNVDVTLLDLGLPDSNGIETFQTVQDRAPTLPIIVMTCLHEEDLINGVLRDGAQDYLVKGEFDEQLLRRSIQYAIERKHSEEQLRKISETRQLLLSELDHRVRNNLASLMSLLELSSRSYQDVASFAQSMKQRVQMMATVHTLLSRARWTSIELTDLIRALVPQDQLNALVMTGPRLVVPVRQVTALGMVIHELITNSHKYGALTKEEGQLHLRWTVEEDEPTRAKLLHIEWLERDGPSIAREPTSGLGTELIRGLARSELGGRAELTFARDGAHHRITVRLDHRHEPARYFSSTSETRS